MHYQHAKHYALREFGDAFSGLPCTRLAGGASGRRLRVGFLSADFHEHATAICLRRSWNATTGRDSKLVAYSFGP
jgi:hypothetical protein